jgi:MoaA/NifB/PqqE/SkfB family radical SAM enzyme
MGGSEGPMITAIVDKIRSQGVGTFLRSAGGKAEYWARREWDYLTVKPLHAVFFLTYRCTSRCKTCTMWQRRSREDEMDLQGWKTAVDRCYEMGVRSIEIFGGDALLRKEVLVPLTEYIKSFPDLHCHLPTNSNLMDEETALGLVRAGMDDFWISIDGVASSHDRVRGGDGTFDRVMRCVDRLLEARGDSPTPSIRANCTISKYNADSFHEVLSLAEERGLDGVHLEYVGEFPPQAVEKSSVDGITATPYFVQQDGESVLVSEEQAYRIKERIELMKREAVGMRTVLFTKHIDKLTIENMVSGRFDNKRCYRIREKVTIDPFGNVAGCPFFANWVMGNIQDEDAGQIWRNEKHRAFMRAFREGPLPLCDYCVLGVQMNRTLFQDVRDEFIRLSGRVRM